MPGQAIGRKLVVGIYHEGTYGSSSGVTTGEKAYIRQNNLAGSIAQIVDDTLSGFRGEAPTSQGNKDVSGQIPTILAPQSCAKWFKHLIGLSSTTYAVARKTTNNLPAVEVLRAESGSASGNGTITFTASGTSATWAENGNTAGSGVNIGTPGDYTLASANGKQLYIRVYAVPGSNTTETVAITANTAFEHVFTPRATETTGLLIEANAGTEIDASRRFIQFLGCVLASADFRFPSSGNVEVSYDVRGANFKIDAGAALDSSLDDFGHTAFSMFNATIYINGIAGTRFKEASLKLDNDVDDTQFVIGGGGTRGSIPRGFFKYSGMLKAQFADEITPVLDDALAHTLRHITIALKAGSGDGSVGNEALIIRIPDVRFKFTTPKTTGPKGVDIDIEFMGERPSAAESRFEICLRSTRAAAGI